MKTHHKKYILSIFICTVIGLFGALSAGHIIQTIQNMRDNPLILQLKSQLSKYANQRRNERVYLHLDKPFYKPTETIWFQAYIQDEITLKPSSKSEIVYVKLINPAGNVEKELHLIAKNGIAQGDFYIRENMGGLYKIEAYTKLQLNDPAQSIYKRDIQIQKVVLPRLKMKPDFERKAYGAGDQVTATLELQTLQNQPLKNHSFTYIASLEGKEILKKKGKTNRDGKAIVRFNLPKKITTTDGLVNFMIEYDGQIESVSRSIPIVLNHIDLKLFPEGGDLVEGLHTKVAFQGKNEFDKPADFQAMLLDEKNNEILRFNSFHQGMGAFSFTPQKNKSYHVKILNPKGIKNTFALPEALERGYTLNVEPQNSQQIALNVSSTEDEELSIIGQVRGQIFYSNAFHAIKGKNLLSVDVSKAPTGVAQFTLFDKKGIERAERLVFVNKKNRLDIKISTDKEKYLPREKVKLNVEVKDERGMPIPANLSLSVTDDKLISFADDKQGHILSKLLLESDLVGKIEEPNFYFDPKETKADQALDYLLMTRGWRKFIWKEIRKEETFLRKYQPEKAAITGRVYLNKTTYAKGVKIKVVGEDISTTSDANGRFRFDNIDLSKKAVDLSFEIEQQRVEKTIRTYGHHNITMLTYLYETMTNLPQKLGSVAPDEVDGAAPPVKLRRIMRKKGAKSKKKNKILNVNIHVEDEEEEEPEYEETTKDIRFAKKAEEIMQEVNKFNIDHSTSYYRARVFPKVIYKADEIPTVRTDFRSTIFWQGNIQTDRRGKATLEFYNSDEVTSFRVTAEGVGVDGLIGHSEMAYFTQLPFSMRVKLPVAVTMGDQLKIPLTLKNNTQKTLSGKLDIISPKAWKAHFEAQQNERIKAGETKVIYLDYSVLNQPGKDNFIAKFQSSWANDAFQQEVITEAKGFPVALAISSEQQDQKHKFNITNPIEGTVNATFTAYPTVLSDMLAGIESIIREPHGCFEQTSSSTYPNVMVLEYMQEHNYNNEAIIAKAQTMIDKGYKRLVTFETLEKGYEWFGRAPAHEALTAYGLMEFRDMASVYANVDAKMVGRTAKWLLSRRDGKGGFLRKNYGLDGFGNANQNITNAYIVYALTEAGLNHQSLQKEVEASYQEALKSKDPYQVSLMANVLLNLKDSRSKSLISMLLKTQRKDGSWEGSTHSITHSTGKGLKIETSALALLAILKSEVKANQNIRQGAKFIINSRSSYGGFGNTQSTILALKALIQYAKLSKKTSESGDIVIYLDDKKIAKKHYEAGESQAISIAIPSKLLTQGTHLLRIKYQNTKNALPYTFGVEYSTFLPRSSEECVVDLDTKLSKNKVKVGETVRMNTVLTNTKTEGLPMTMAIVGIPAGLSPQPWQLKKLQEEKAFDYYEIKDNNIAFYYRHMKPSEVRQINLDLKAEIKGTYQGVASSAYLYYTNEYKKWVKAEAVTIH